MTGIFINFRVGDQQDTAVMLDQRLALEFGADRVFRSSRSIAAGTEFTSALLDGVRTASVVLVLIGPGWLNATDRNGNRRLDDPEDWVRKEIAEALRTGRTTIPLLSKDVTLPKASDLPGDIAGLATRQGRRLDYRTAEQDIAALIHELIEVDPDLGIGTREGIEDLRTWLTTWRHLTDPPLPTSLPVLGREREVEKIRTWLEGPASIQALQAPSRTEAAAFIATVVKEHRPELRAVLVSSTSGWQHSQHLTGPLLVVLDCADIVVSASMSLPGHVVLVDNAEHGSRNDPLVLPRLPRDKTSAAFAADGVSHAVAVQHAGIARRSLTSLRRKLARTTAAPRWADHPTCDLAAPLVLVGRWRANTAADQAILVEVTDRDIDKLERFLTGPNQGDDPLFHRSGNRWQLADPHDAWTLLHRRLTAPDLSRWRQVADRVLGENDPTLSLPEDQRITASLFGHERKWTDDLRYGFAQGAALLGSARETPLADGTIAGDHAALLVRDLLDHANEDQSGLRWQSLADVLPLLAEAAPSQFLDAIDTGLSGDQPVLRTMFTDRTDVPVFGMGRSRHTELLWALETLSWSADYLPMVVSVLAELARIDPGGQTADRPATTLLVLLQPWFPYLDIAMDRRVELIRSICRRTPEVGWQLLLDLLAGPDDHLLMPPQRPVVRTEWPVPTPPVPLTGDGFDDEMLLLALSELDNTPSRWVTFLDKARWMPRSRWDRVLDSLERVNPDDLGDQRFELWDLLHHLTAQHRQFSAESSALPEDLLSRIDACAAAVEPPSNPRRAVRLFSWQPALAGVDPADYIAHGKVAERLRKEAVSLVLREHGVAGLRELAAASDRPELVGDVAALIAGDDIRDELLPFVLADRLAAGWAWRMATEHGPGWSSGVLQRLEDGEDVAVVAFLLTISVDQAFAALDTMREPVQHKYWADVDGWPLPEGQEERFLARLLGRRRPWAAIRGLAMCLYDSDIPNPSTSIVEHSLQLVLEADVDTPDQHSWYEVGRLLDHLVASDADVMAIARLELAFHHVLKRQRKSDTLYRILGENPELFVEVYCQAHPEEGAAPRGAMVPVWWALREMRRLPGLTAEGLDGEALKNWVATARESFAKRDRTKAGDEAIGVVLSGSPAGLDGAWPAEAVRDILDATDAKQLRTGFLVGLVNNRGTTIRDGYEGGRKERKLADKYIGWAQRIDVGWPRVAKLLREYVEHLRSEGRRHDDSAEQLHDEG